jgi:molybdenum cofactor cytidylyltransferase
MIRTVALQALQADIAEAIFVLGNDALRIRAELDDLPAETENAGAKIKFAYNEAFAAGLSGSVHKGLEAVDPQSAGALMLMGDQPFVSPDIINSLLQAFREQKPALVVPLYRQGPASPVLFSRDLFPALRAVRGDKGGRDIVRQYLQDERERVATVPVASVAAGMDIDTIDDYRKAPDPL